jgi:hypothetical protein
VTEKLPVQKGQLIVVKAPPLYDKEYFYEVHSAGDKLVRANLYHSPKVKKSWSLEEFRLLIEHGMVRIANEGEKPPVPVLPQRD